MDVTNRIFKTHTQTLLQPNQSKGNNGFSELLAAYQQNHQVQKVEKPATNAVFSMNTSQGDQQEINLDEYLTPGALPNPVNLKDIPLLLPTAHNIDTLSKYSQNEFKALLAQYGIPSPPASIEFNTQGQLVLPADYAYSTQLTQAFTENPKVENALRTTAAIASHYAGIMEGQPFRDEMSTARNQVDRDRIVAKYSYLFDDNRPAIQIVLSFLDDGSMLLGEKS
ncbi:hypothetical protein Q4567_09780 [Aliiglaciecola sp. 2_MG-2023]|uniref:hypothetical protein n=1 Tax=Alteromonadaceae TaxID=72275 RepID=UPI0026E43513|nr:MULTISPECIES: hypothetical protein [unclassified Aliiglaciecola]MDO6711008.1 hypothetical protein [Aliiglaciecola sp. 2_MG-2023]MDO6754218.1 hypothetical protein [Aliiglaciecola sp. 1_MG-2023]